MSRELLFSVTKSDFKWETMRGSGKGGQHRNKRDTAVRCTHPPSGAVGYAEDSKSQQQNRKTAWRRCIERPEFQRWIKIEIARRSRDQAEEHRLVRRRVDEMMRDTLVEVGDGDEWRKPEPEYEWEDDE